MQRLTQEGLGRGINFSKPHLLQNVQVDPTEKNLDMVTAGARRFDIYDEREMISSRQKQWDASFGLKALQVVSFRCGFQSQTEESSAVKKSARKIGIFKRKVFFKEAMEIDSSKIHYVDKLKVKAKENGVDYNQGKDIPGERRDNICKEVVIASQGVLHYVSSVDLGAVEYEVTSENEHARREGMGIEGQFEGGVNAAKANISGGYSGEETKMGRYVRHEVDRVSDKGVDVIEGRVETEQEKAIAYEVKPVWNLVADAAWRESLRKACKDYMDEHTPISMDQGTCQ